MEAISIRLASLLLVASLGALPGPAQTTALWLTYSLGLSHYLMALLYARRTGREFVVARPLLVGPLALAALTAGLYTLHAPLIGYFGLHHALNEAYSREREIREGRGAGWRAFLVHALAYVLTLRAELALPVPLQVLVAVGLGVACAEGWRHARRGSAAGQPIWRDVVDRWGIELSSVALLLVSFLTPISFLDVVLYHFLLWTVAPLRKLRRAGRGSVARYVALSAVTLTAAVVLSPLGPRGLQLGAATYVDQFLFWSYLHITLSFALSDAHPAWLAQLLRPPVAAAAGAQSRG